MPAEASDGWVSLFNGRNLDGWYTFLQNSGRDVAQARGMVSVEEGMLRVMGNRASSQAAEAGYLATNQEYENVRIRVEYKWGTKRFAPRLENKRDNGLLYHLVGKDVVWPTCVECQIQETDVGDYFMLGGTRAVQAIKPVCIAVRMVPLFDSVYIPWIAQQIDEQGAFTSTDALDASAGVMFDELVKMTEVLRPLRA